MHRIFLRIQTATLSVASHPCSGRIGTVCDTEAGAEPRGTSVVIVLLERLLATTLTAPEDPGDPTTGLDGAPASRGVYTEQSR